jgi:hypothetical protein
MAEIWWVSLQNRRRVIAQDGRTVASVKRADDAHVLAAAPELLEALEQMLELHALHYKEPVHAKARAAVGKAKGYTA